MLSADTGHVLQRNDLIQLLVQRTAQLSAFSTPNAALWWDGIGKRVLWSYTDTSVFKYTVHNEARYVHVCTYSVSEMYLYSYNYVYTELLILFCVIK